MYLKGRVTEQERHTQRERERFYLLIHSPNECISQGWASPKPESRISMWISHAGTRAKNTYVIFHCFLRCMSRKWNQKQSSQNLLWPNLLCHNTSVSPIPLDQLPLTEPGAAPLPGRSHPSSRSRNVSILNEMEHRVTWRLQLSPLSHSLHLTPRLAKLTQCWQRLRKRVWHCKNPHVAIQSPTSNLNWLKEHSLKPTCEGLLETITMHS